MNEELSDEQHNALLQIVLERNRQDAKWGIRLDQPDMIWLGILAEEFGEVAKETVDMHFAPQEAEGGIPIFWDTKHLEKELIQTAAVCVAWYESLIKNRNSKSKKT